jgi:hypothetical protein
MLSTYGQGGKAAVYWLTLPAPRDSGRARIARVVNAALTAAAGREGPEVRLLDTRPVFTPSGRYSDTIDVDGRKTIVRESDGVHLNDAGASVTADAVIAAIRRDFTW